VLFAEASSWKTPIRFRGGVGGHLDALSVQRASRNAGVKRLVLAHIGRPTLRAIERGACLTFGELARDRQIFSPRAFHEREDKPSDDAGLEDCMSALSGIR